MACRINDGSCYSWYFWKQKTKKKKRRKDEPVEQMAQDEVGSRRRQPEQQPPQPQKEPAAGVVKMQPDPRRTSGITTEIFNQIQQVENEAGVPPLKKNVEMSIRVLESGATGAPKHNGDDHSVQNIEIVKRPGQTLGLYIREGNGWDRTDGVFISRMASGSVVEQSRILRVGDEVICVNSVDVTHMSLDDVVIIMSIPRRLVLSVRSPRTTNGKRLSLPGTETEEAAVARPAPQHRSSSYSAIPATEQLDDDALYYNSQPARVTRVFAQAAYTYSEGSSPRSEDSERSSDRSDYYLVPEHRADHQHRAAGPRHLERAYISASGKLKLAPSQPLTGGARSLRPGETHQPPPRHDKLSPKHHHHHHQEARTWARQNHERYSQQPSVSTVAAEARPARSDIYRPVYIDPRAAPHYYPPSAVVVADRSGYTTDGGYVSDGGYVERRQSGRVRGTLSPECASDSEVSHVYTSRHGASLQRRRTAGGGGSSDGGGSSGGESDGDMHTRSNSLPRMTSNGEVAEFRHWLQKFDALSHELQEMNGSDAAAKPCAAEKSASHMKVKPSKHSGDVFTSEEYRAWLNRVSSTSAIYESIRSQRHADIQKRFSRIQSAENVYDANAPPEGADSGASTSADARPLQTSLARGPSDKRGASATVKRVRYLLDDGGKAYIPNPSPTRASESRQTPLDINPSDFLRYKAEKFDETHRSRKTMSGALTVQLYGGRGLKTSTRSDQYRDLYCVVEVDRLHKARTGVRTGDQNFDWDEAFDVDLAQNQELDFLVYSWDPQFRHNLCYKASVYLIPLFRHYKTLNLAVKTEPRGTLYVRLGYTEPKIVLKRTPSIRRNALFGVDLETTVRREATGHCVPVLVKRCVEEVEKRGLDIVGLYQLCGSTQRRRELKQAFEQDARLACLAPDNEPDVNVITGVMKDYLRELPEPLITDCLYQMVVDALSVCLPEDPEGSARLMLSILDCLPKTNKATLTMVLDHLKLVTSFSERNKMTEENLATCVGPALLCPSPGSGGRVLDFRKPIEVMKHLLTVWPSKPASSSSSNSDEGAVGGLGASGKGPLKWSVDNNLPESSC